MLLLMTQKKAESIIDMKDEPVIRRSTRIENSPLDLFDPNEPRVGRRESEPHSAEINYIYDILTSNFPESRTIWDLHHYFIGKKGPLKDKKIDIQFDLSFFKDLTITYTLSSYDAGKYEGRIPDMAINILSKSTWRADLSENVDTCKNLGLKVYIVYSPFKMTSKIYHPPFLRVYILNEEGIYKQEELNDITLNEGGAINKENIIDVSDILPFRLGLMLMKQQHEGEHSLYRLVFLHPKKLELFSSRIEKLEHEKEQLTQEKEQLTQEKEQLIQEKVKTEQSAKELEKRLKKYQEKFGKLD